MKIPVKLKLRLFWRALLTVLINPRYFTVAAISTFGIAGVIIWSLNFELMRYVLFEAPLTLLGKIEFFMTGYSSLFTTFNHLLSVSILIFSVLFGFNVALLAYVIRRQGFKAVPKKSGGGAFLFAMLGGGCIACGTSLLAPILATLGATSVPFARDLGAIITLIGSLLIIYSIHKLSLMLTRDGR